MDTWPPYPDDNLKQEDDTDDMVTDELENELPKVVTDQFSLATVVQRLAGDLYGHLLLNAETLGSLPDSNKKAKLMKWIQDSQKQVAKAAVLCKWARNADDIQKAMNVSAFLRTQAQQFEWAHNAITSMKDRVHQYRVRNPDLLTSLDVLSAGQYTRFPTVHQDEFVPKKPFTKPEIAKAFSQVEDIMRVSLKTKDLVPVEMSDYRIEKGRAFFRVPGRFETSLIMTGAHEDDIWAFVSVEFLFNIPNGENKGIKEFPRFPPKAYRDQLAFQVVDIISPPAIPEQPLASAVVDAPLIRVYNFLQLLSMHYLLEVLLYQAGQLSHYGWNKRIQVRTARDRKIISVAYWIRPSQTRTDPGGVGGELIISIVSASSIPGTKPYRTATDRVRMQLQGMAKLKGRVPSDEVEELAFRVQWIPIQATGGAALSTKDTSSEGLAVDPDNLDLEALLMTVIRRHAAAVMRKHWENARSHQYRELFPHSEDLTTVLHGDEPGLRLRLSSHHSVTVTLDVRSGEFILINDATGLDSVARGTKYRDVADRINQNPQRLLEELAQLRNNMIIENIAVKARYLGLTAHTHRILTGAAQFKFGKHHGLVYIQLAKFPQNYLVILINAQEQNFKYALITLKENDPGMGVFTVMDFAWVDAEKLKGVQNHNPQVPGFENTPCGVGHAPGLLNSGHTPDPFDIDIGFLRDVHSYCRARVAHMLIELQLKARSIPYTHVLPRAPELPPRRNSNEGDAVAEAEIQFNVRSPLAQFVPNLCVQASDMLAGPAAAAAEAAMPNIRIEPINWWTVDKPCQVHTSVMLKYVQPPLRRSEEGGIGSGEGKTIMRPSEKIVYDTTTGVISFWSGEVTECVGEFLAEWERVSKVVVIARQVSTMPKLRGWTDVRLLSFDLQTVEFAYSRDYALSITCSEGSYLFSFWRCDAPSSSDSGPAEKDNSQMSPEQGARNVMDVDRSPLAAPPTRRNAHEDSEQFIKGLLKDDHLSASVFDLVRFLRDTIGIVEELERIEEEGSDKVEVLVKAAGWYRILYSNSRVFNPGGVTHALDIRLMQEGKVLVIDGSQRIHRSFKGKGKQGIEKPPALEAVLVADHSANSHGLLLGSLLPIPRFEQIVGEVVASAGGTGAVGYDKGLVAVSDLARGMLRELHERVLEAL